MMVQNLRTNNMTLTKDILISYLALLGIYDHSIRESDDQDLGHILVLSIPRNNNNVGRLLGKHGRNEKILGQFLHVCAGAEGVDLKLVVKLLD